MARHGLNPHPCRSGITWCGLLCRWSLLANALTSIVILRRLGLRRQLIYFAFVCLHMVASLIVLCGLPFFISLPSKVLLPALSFILCTQNFSSSLSFSTRCCSSAQWSKDFTSPSSLSSSPFLLLEHSQLGTLLPFLLWLPVAVSEFSIFTNMCPPASTTFDQNFHDQGSLDHHHLVKQIEPVDEAYLRHLAISSSMQWHVSMTNIVVISLITWKNLLFFFLAS